MRILIIDHYYPAFLRNIYSENPLLEKGDYNKQWQFIMDQHFGVADYYSLNLKKLGCEATEIIPNCRPLQASWAKEYDISSGYRFKILSFKGIPIPWFEKDWLYSILLAQIKEYSPDIILIQEPGSVEAVFVKKIRPYVRLIAAQIACPIPQNANFYCYDIIFSSFPHYVENFRKQGIKSVYLKLAFEPRILKYLDINAPKKYGVVFIGGLSAFHNQRIQFLEKIAERVKFDWWGYGFESLSKQSILRNCYRGEAWGLKIYEIMCNAKIALNHHINVAENYANNMRLYEATGVGTMLLTDKKDNLSQLFELDNEVVAYLDFEDCIKKIEYYLCHNEERSLIAAAGQKRTLLDHNYFKRMEDLVNALKENI